MHEHTLDRNAPSARPLHAATASRVLDDGRLVELLYDRGRRATSLAVWRDGSWTRESSVTLVTNERLVPYSRDNNLIRNEVVLLPSEPADYGATADLVRAIGTYIGRYVDLSSSFTAIACHYVLLSWLYDAFSELPYLRLRGDFGTGKTRALIVIGSICYKPFFASGASTVSPIFHTLDAFRGTLVFDEADFRFSDEKAQIVKILNNGNVAGLPVLRTMPTNGKEWDPRAFHVFGPKIVATRGGYDDRALESRFLTEDMGQRAMRTDIPINLPDRQKVEALELRNKLLLFRFRNRASARVNETFVDPALEPRLNQILVPLLSVIDELDVRHEVMRASSSFQEALRTERTHSIEGLVLEIIAELFAESADGSVPISDIVTRYVDRHGDERGRPITNRWVGSIVRNRLRLTTYKSHGVYVIPRVERTKLPLLCARYGIETGSSLPVDTDTTVLGRMAS